MADDPAANETTDPSADVDLGVTPRSGPTAVSFSTVRDRLSEETGTTRRKWLGNLQVADDGVGTITYALSGVYADVFELDGPTLYLKAGVSLDYGVQQSYTVTVSAWDETVPEDLPVSLEYTLNVTDVEYTPHLHPSSPLAFPAVLEDAAGPTTGGVSDSVLVADILDGFRDEDGDEPGIAIVGTNLHGGTLWFSTDDKATWQDVGEVSESSARVLYADASTYLHFEPAADFSGTVSDVMTIRAWGRKGGYANGEAGVSTAVGEVAFESLPPPDELLGPSDFSVGIRQTQIADVTDISNPEAVADVVASIEMTEGAMGHYDWWWLGTSVITPDGSAFFALGQGMFHANVAVFEIDAAAYVGHISGGWLWEHYEQRIKDLLISPDGSTLFAFYSQHDYGRPLQVDVYDISELTDIHKVGTFYESGSGPNTTTHLAADGTRLYSTSDWFNTAFDLKPSQWFSPRQHQVGVEVVAVNDAPTALLLHDVVESVPEDIDTTSGVRVADLEVVDDELGTNLILLTGADAEFFEVAGSQLFLKAGTQLDYNTKDHYAVTVSVFDNTVEDSERRSIVVELGVTPRSGPTAVSFSTVRDRLSEETGTTRRKWLGNLQVADDGVGTITYALSGVYADVFELDGPTLYLKAGVSLDYGVQQSYTVTVSAWDETVPEDLPVSLEYTLNVTDVEYTPHLHPSSPLAFPAVLEDAAGPTTGGVSDSVLVADILDGFRDEDGDEPGIAIVGTNLHGGTLWFSTDDKATWQDVGEVSESSARVLYADASTYLHFEPAADFSGTVSDVMTIRAWGRKGGYANGEAGVSTAVGEVAFESLPPPDELLGPGDFSVGIRTEDDPMMSWRVVSFADVRDISNPEAVADVVASIEMTEGVQGGYPGDWYWSRTSVITPDGSALFVLGQGMFDANVAVFEIDSAAYAGSISDGWSFVNYGGWLTDLLVSPDGSTLFAAHSEGSHIPPRIDVYDVSELTDIHKVGTFYDSGSFWDSTMHLAAHGTRLYSTSDWSNSGQAFDLTPYQWFSPRQHQVGVEVVAVNDAPTALLLHDVVESVPEDIDTTAGVRVADLEVVDDELGTNLILLTGADAEFFEVAGSQLFLKAGTQLDYNTKDHYAVTVSVCDPTVAGRRMPLCRVIIGAPPAHGRPLQEIESNGDVVLARDEDGFLFANGRAVRLFGAGQQGLFMREWTILSAETVGGQNYLITRHESGAMHRFGADSTWAMYGSELMTVPDNRGPSSNRSLNALSAESREMAFGGDLQSMPHNDDAPAIDPGAVDGSSSEPVPEFNEYQAVAAEVTQHGREILLINRDRTAAVELLFDDDWIFIGVLKSFEINPGHIRRLEQKFYADLTNFVGQQEA